MPEIQKLKYRNLAEVEVGLSIKQNVSDSLSE